MSIQSVERAIDILNAIANKRCALGLPELSKTLNLPKTTIHTLVKTLREKGFLQQDPGTKKYGLGFALFELGAIQMAELEIQRVASPMLDQLANNLVLECRLGIWHQRSVIVTQYAHPLGRNRPHRQVGPRIPAYCTALGKAILAHLPEQELDDYFNSVELISYTTTTITVKEKLREELLTIQKQGYAIANGELIPYRSSLGAPIFGPEERIEGAISLSLGPQQSSWHNLDVLASQLLRTAHDLSLALGCPPIRKLGKPA
jgi:DNA-binding IclR family transcriptional regulator